MGKGERIIIKILEDLNGRSGFDAFWDTVDKETQDEIFTALWRIVDEVIADPHFT